MLLTFPKEGQVDVTYFGAGSLKTMPLGKEKSFFLFDENGLSVGEGLLDHMTWHCWGVGDGINTVIAFRGDCVGTDPRGTSSRSNLLPTRPTSQSRHTPSQTS